MADHRKLTGPRRLIFGGRHLPRSRLLGAALAFLCAVSVLPGAVFAQEVGLKRGETSLNSGQYEDAVRQLSATVNDADSTLNQASKALYLRGIAYRKLGYPGRAVSDLGAAVWLGLGHSDKVRALVNKGLAFRAAGLTSQGEAALAQARRASNAGEVQRLIAQDSGAAAVASTTIDDGSSGAPSESVWSRIVPSFGSSGDDPEPAPAPSPSAEPAPAATQTAEAAPSTGWDASVSDGTEQSGGNAVSRWFGSLTGGGSSSSAPPATTPPIAPPPATRTATATSTATRTAAIEPPSAESWAANTEAVSESEGGTAIGRWWRGRSESAPTPAAAPTPPGGGYTVQLANSRSRSEAQALWQKAKGGNPQIASASPRIETVDIGDFGTFYTIKIGPYPSQSEGNKVCNALKRRGTDCSVISPDGP